MSLPMQVALTVGPLACYFYVVGVWQSGRHPAGRGRAARLRRARLRRQRADDGRAGRPGPDAADLRHPGPVGLGPLGRLPGALGGGLRHLGRAADRRLQPRARPARPRRSAGRWRAFPARRSRRSLGGFEAADEGRAVLVEGIARLRVGTVDARGREPEALIRPAPAPAPRVSWPRSPRARRA